MRRHRHILIGVATVLLLGAMVLFWSAREPDLLGRPTHYWILPWQSRAETPEAIAAAHAAMGASHVRWLRGQLDWSPSRFRKVLDALARAIRFSASFQKQDDYREQAIAALGRLGQRARPAIPKLRALSESDDPFRKTQLRAAAMAALIQLGEASSDKYVAIVQDPHHRDWFFAADVLARVGTNQPGTDRLFAAVMFGPSGPAARARATFLYGYVDPPTREAVSNLTRALDSADTREIALRRLVFMGTNAASATSAVRRCLSDTNQAVRVLATNALVRIAPPAGP
jgi:hypothetical protein